MILVFGGDGQVGRELSRAAASQGEPLRALSRGEADISETAAVSAAFSSFKPNLVVNAAAYTKVDLAETNVEQARRDNELGPAVLANACASAEVPLVHISTDYVFDGTKASAYLESDPLFPVSIYGITKAAGERAVRSSLRHHIILRTAWVYSEFGHNFLKTILRLAANRDELRIVADQYGSPTSARRIAEAILIIAPFLTRKEDVWGTYHFTADGFTTWFELAKRIVAIQAPISSRNPRVVPIKTSEYPMPAKRPANSRLNCRLIKEVFGVSAPHWTADIDVTAKALAESDRKPTDHVA